MTEEPPSDVPLAIIGVAVLIGALASWASLFSHSCRSDGCIGLVFPAGGAVIALAVQLLILLPSYGLKDRGDDKRSLRTVLIWGGVSLVAFVLPISFLKW